MTPRVLGAVVGLDEQRPAPAGLVGRVSLIQIFGEP